MTSENRGLVAVGAAGQWTVDIDQDQGDGFAAFGVQIQHATVTVQFGLPDLSVLSRLVAFLESQPLETFTVDAFMGGTLNFVFDEDRLFVRALGPDGYGSSALLGVAFNDSEWPTLSEALKDAMLDLD